MSRPLLSAAPATAGGISAAAAARLGRLALVSPPLGIAHQGNRLSVARRHAAPRPRCAAAAPGPASEHQRPPQADTASRRDAPAAESSSNIVPKPSPSAAPAEFNWQKQWYPLVCARIACDAACAAAVAGSAVVATASSH